MSNKKMSKKAKKEARAKVEGLLRELGVVNTKGDVATTTTEACLSADVIEDMASSRMTSVQALRVIEKIDEFLSGIMWSQFRMLLGDSTDFANVSKDTLPTLVAKINGYRNSVFGKASQQVAELLARSRFGRSYIVTREVREYVENDGEFTRHDIDFTVEHKRLPEFSVNIEVKSRWTRRDYESLSSKYRHGNNPAFLVALTEPSKKLIELAAQNNHQFVVLGKPKNKGVITFMQMIVQIRKAFAEALAEKFPKTSKPKTKAAAARTKAKQVKAKSVSRAKTK